MTFQVVYIMGDERGCKAAIERGLSVNVDFEQGKSLMAHLNSESG